MTQLATNSTPPGEQSPPAFADAPVLAARLVRAVALTIASVALVLAGTLLLARRPQWQSAFLPALVVTLLAALLSLPAMVFGLFGSYYRAVGGCLIAMIVRGLVTAAGLLVAVVVLHRSPLAMLLLATPLYFAQLAAECAVLVSGLGAKA